ncbi:hypothetical protein HYPSUDRAFT_49528 [Hypholoma sublateritium FD-334 SS-4]|uniref:Fungal-type protein kinase domain-containing protein n=1 Tax=Hypholoma sublateritium (strain FD-334 SS-4) TaxID=945553 RepID=A0A0D2N3S5_HYPSF|nr:hypothetical protein HYPSUDRAFT_49528 [Hypholoma sublateritium FD-334 SS-4]
MDDINPLTDFQERANKCSEIVHSSLGLAPGLLIVFRDKFTLHSSQHETATTGRPDLIATTSTDDVVPWAAIETTVQFQLDEEIDQSTSYAACLLQTHPHRLAVQVLRVTDGNVVLATITGKGIRNSTTLIPEEFDHLILLLSFYQSLYTPNVAMVDLSVPQRQSLGANHWCFDITLPGDLQNRFVDEGYRISYDRNSFHQKAKVSINNTASATTNHDPNAVSEEAESDIPDGVQKGDSSGVGLEHGTPWDRPHMSPGSAEYGTSIFDLKTPQEFLCAIYDALETSRVMYRNHGVLHGNLSFASILSRVGDEPPAPVHAADHSNPAPGTTSQMDETADP